MQRNYKPYIIRIFILLIFFTSLGLYFKYVSEINYYGDFCITVTNSDSCCISDDFIVCGLSHFGDTIPISLTEQGFCNYKNSYFVKLLIKNKYVYSDEVCVNFNSGSLNTFFKEEVLVGNKFGQLFIDYHDCRIFKKIQHSKYLLYLTIFVFVLSVFLMIVIIRAKSICLLIQNVCRNNDLTRFCVFLFIFVSLIAIAFYLHKNDQKPNYSLSEFSNVISFNYFLQNESEGYQIVIEDKLNVGLDFVFEVNGNFWFNNDSILYDIKNQDVKNVSEKHKEIIQVLKFVTENTYHRYPSQSMYDNDVLQEPILLLNSTGFGLCSDRANVLCALLEGLGYKTRIRNLKGLHSFPEIFDGTKWVIVDPDYGLYFVNSHNDLLSLQELSIDKNIILRRVNVESFICNFENVVNPLPKRLIDIYMNDSLAIYSEARKVELSETNFVLPPKSKIIFPLYDDILGTYLMKIRIPGNYAGKVKIPLLVYNIENNQNAITDSLLDYALLYDEFEVSGKEMIIYAFINPLLFTKNDEEQISFNYYSNKFYLPFIDIEKRSTDTDLFLSVSHLVKVINQNRDEYLKIAEEIIDKYGSKVNTWEDIEEIASSSYYNNVYPLWKLNALENIFACYSGVDDDMIVQDWISKPENIALLFILLDHCDDIKTFELFHKYLEIIHREKN